MGNAHQLFVYLVAGKNLAAFGGFALLAHAGPNVGVNGVGIGCGGKDIVGELELVAILLGKCKHGGVGLVALGGGDGDLHAGLEAADDEGVGHVVAIADVAHVHIQAALVLPHRLQIRQHLAGMAEVGQAVDDRDGAVLGQVFHFLLGKGADHDAVQIAAQNAGGVFHGFAAADLQVVGRKEHAHAAQLVDAGLEGNTGAGGGLLEDHAQGLALQGLVVDAVLQLIFQLVGHVQQLHDLFGGTVKQLQKMVHRKTLRCSKLALTAGGAGAVNFGLKQTVPGHGPGRPGRGPVRHR